MTKDVREFVPMPRAATPESIHETPFRVRRPGYQGPVFPFSRVLVTGGAGFLGTHLCEHLLDDGIDVVSVDDLSSSAVSAAQALTTRSGYHFVQRDICDPDLVDELGTGFDAVFHLASPASPPDYQRRPIDTLRAGSSGTTTALEIARRAGARFVLASTSEVYGDPERHPQPESYWGNVNPIGPRSMYDEAKRYAEALASAYRRAGLVDVGIARIFNTYGPGMRPDDGRMIPTFCVQALSGKALTVSGSGQQTRSLCYVDDTVSALIALAYSTFGGPVNIGNPVELTVLAVAEYIRDLAESDSAVEFIAGAVDDPRRRCPDIDIARKQLGWQPLVDYHSGLRNTVQWFRDPDRMATSGQLAR
ncbi:epimerase [Mycobacterium sp. 1100029.7]|nr:epimerase [Mycobacterium sp. 1100029.7]